MSLAASTETLARALALKTPLTTSPGTPSGKEMSLTFLGKSTMLKSQADPGNLIFTTARAMSLRTPSEEEMSLTASTETLVRALMGRMPRGDLRQSVNGLRTYITKATQIFNSCLHVQTFSTTELLQSDN